MSIKKKRKIKVELTKKSIQNAIDELRNFSEGIEISCREVAEVIGELGVETAKTKLLQSNPPAYLTGELHDTIEYEIKEADGKYYVFIRPKAPHFMYVEFGTGIIGKDSPKHPLHSAVGWKHDMNNHGYDGWYYKGDDGEVHHTWGQPARPFLYETVAELEASLPEVVRKVFTK